MSCFAKIKHEHTILFIFSFAGAEQRWAAPTGDSERGPRLVNPKKQQKNPQYDNSGMLIVDQCSIRERPSFLDYIAGDFFSPSKHVTAVHDILFVCRESIDEQHKLCSQSVGPSRGFLVHRLFSAVFAVLDVSFF